MLDPHWIESLHPGDNPELSLVTARHAIAARLELLAGYLAPGERRIGPATALKTLETEHAFDHETAQAIRDVLSTANPVVHGKRVPPSVAAVVVDSAFRVSSALDKMIFKVQEDIKHKSARTQLAFAYLTLPRVTQRSIAMRTGLAEPTDRQGVNKEFAKLVFKRAQRSDRLRELWIETARENTELSMEPPPELE